MSGAGDPQKADTISEPSRSKTGVFALSSILAFVPILVLIGWQLNLSEFKRSFNGLTPMNPLTAICFMLLAVALAVRLAGPRARRVGSICAGLVGVVAIARLLAYALGTGFPLDQSLFHGELVKEPVPNQMAWSTALVFLLVSLGYMSAAIKARWSAAVAQGAAALSGLSALLVVDSYAFRALSAQADSIPMALNTALLFLVASAGIFLSTRGSGFLGVLSGGSLGSRTARPMLWAALLLPLGLGLFIEEIRRQGLLGQEFGDALMVGLISGILLLLVLRSAQSTALAETAITDARLEAERANLAKSEFLSRMSHELRTPLNAILGFAQIMRLEGVSDRHADCLNHISTGGKHLLSMINEVLDIARIESGHLAMSPEPVDVSSAIREVVDLLRPSAEARQISLRLDLKAVAGVFVTADGQRLRQVLINLLSNAIKYNVDGGQVEIGGGKTGVGRVELTVTDTGVGIDEAALPEMFSPFARLGAETTSVEGTGLGLALSKRLVDGMGGCLTYRPNPQGGSIFAVELAETLDQLSRLQGDLERLRADGPLHGGACTVLAIEDNASNVALLLRIFEARPNVRLKALSRGEPAQEAARELQPNLVLLDVNLPDMSGEEVLRRLKADAHTADIPVIIVSADATPRTAKSLMALGAHRYLTKPLDVSKLIELVDDCTEALSA